MKAIYKHELASCFTNMTIYVFSAFLLLFTGIFVLIYNLNGMMPNFEYVLEGISFVFMITVPILTMRTLAEERRQRTDQLLYSLPLSMTEVVLGKYFALLTAAAMPILVMAIYPLILCSFGNVWLPAAYGNLIAFYLLGAALIAIGVFVSSITENQAIAAGLCFVVMLLNYFMTPLAGYIPNSAVASLLAFTALVVICGVIVWSMTKSGIAGLLTAFILQAALLIWYILDTTGFEGMFANIISKLSLYDRFYNFVDGVFDLRTVVYYFTVIAIFIFLSVQSLEKRRWSE